MTYSPEENIAIVEAAKAEPKCRRARSRCNEQRENPRLAHAEAYAQGYADAIAFARDAIARGLGEKL